MIHLTVQSGGAAEGTFDVHLRMHLEISTKGACEVALKGALGVAFVLHLWLNF